MKPTTYSKIQMFGAWCGVGYIVAILVGWAVAAGFFPPHSPSASATDIAAIFQTDYTRIRIGMVMVMFSALIFIPFAALFAQYIAKVEGRIGILTISATLGAAGNMMLTFYPAIWWLTAAFRPDRPIELIYLMNDMSWLQFIGGVSIYLAMPLSLMVAAFCDTSATPVFPRWSAFATLFLVVIGLPDQLLFFFHTGPFSWMGIFGLYVPVGSFCVWFFLVVHLLRQEILRERAAA